MPSGALRLTIFFALGFTMFVSKIVVVGLVKAKPLEPTGIDPVFREYTSKRYFRGLGTV